MVAKCFSAFFLVSFSCGVHRSPILVLLLGSIRRTWASDRNRRCLMVSKRDDLVKVKGLRWRSCLAKPFDRFFVDRNEGMMRSSKCLFSPFSSTHFHKEGLPYRRTDFTLLLYNWTLVLRLYCFDFQTG